MSAQGDRAYVVGEDIPAGRWQYKTDLASRSFPCKMHVHRDGIITFPRRYGLDFDREIEPIGAVVDFPIGWLVEFTSECGSFEHKDSAAASPLSTSIQGNRAYIVGEDIPAGRWQYKTHTSNSKCRMYINKDGSYNGTLEAWRRVGDIITTAVGLVIGLNEGWQVALLPECGSFEHKDSAAASPLSTSIQGNRAYIVGEDIPAVAGNIGPTPVVMSAILSSTTTE